MQYVCMYILQPKKRFFFEQSRTSFLFSFCIVSKSKNSLIRIGLYIKIFKELLLLANILVAFIPILYIQHTYAYIYMYIYTCILKRREQEQKLYSTFSSKSKRAPPVQGLRNKLRKIFYTIMFFLVLVTASAMRQQE